MTASAYRHVAHHMCTLHIMYVIDYDCMSLINRTGTCESL